MTKPNWQQSTWNFKFIVHTNISCRS